MRQQFSKISSVVFTIPLLLVMVKYSYGSAIQAIDASPPGVAVSNRSSGASGELLAGDSDFNENLNDNEEDTPKEKCNSCGAVNLCLPTPVQQLNQILHGRRIPDGWTVRQISDSSNGVTTPIYVVKDYPGAPSSSATVLTDPRQYTNELNSIALDHYNRKQVKLGEVLGTLVANQYSRNYIIVGDSSIVKWVNPKYATSCPTTSWSPQAITVLIETGPDNRVSRSQIRSLATIISIESPSNMYTVDLNYLFDVNELPSAAVGVDRGSRSAPVSAQQQAPAKIANIDDIRKELCLPAPPPPPPPPRAS